MELRIGHDLTGLGGPGGVTTYVKRVATAQREQGHHITLFGYEGDPDGMATGTSDATLDVLHAHTFSPARRSPIARRPSGRCTPTGRTAPAAAATSSDGTGCATGRTTSSVARGATWSTGAGSVRATVRRRLPADVVGDATAEGRAGAGDQRVREEPDGPPGYAAADVHVLHLPTPEVHDDAGARPSRRTPPRAAVRVRRPARAGEGRRMARAAAARAGGRPGRHRRRRSGRERVGRLAAELGQADRVVFHGWLSEREVAVLVRASRAVVFPSVWHEPAGLVTLEAAAHGRARSRAAPAGSRVRVAPRQHAARRPARRRRVGRGDATRRHRPRVRRPPRRDRAGGGGGAGEPAAARRATHVALRGRHRERPVLTRSLPTGPHVRASLGILSPASTRPSPAA